MYHPEPLTGNYPFKNVGRKQCFFGSLATALPLRQGDTIFLVYNRFLIKKAQNK